MELEIKEFTQEEWHNIVKDFSDLSLIQTWEYAEAKKNVGGWKVFRFVFHNREEIIGAGQGMMKYIPLLKKGLVWVNRAPLYRRLGDVEDSQRLIEMMKEIKRYFVEEKKMYLRIAPTLIKGDEGGLTNKNFAEAGFNQCNPPQNWSSAIIDLTKSEEELRKSLFQKWRNCLNKSERLGIVCEYGTNKLLLEEFLVEYKKLLENKAFPTNITPDFIRCLQDTLPEGRKMQVFIARQEINELGGILIAGYGKTCMYLCGAVSEEGKKLNANYFLLWQAICQMKKLGFNLFDVGGMDEKLTPPGIFHFKEGLGGARYRLVGEFESYRKNVWNELIRWKIGKLQR